MKLVTKSILIWLLLIAAEIVHGILRAITLVPLVGEFRANQIGVLTGSVIILFIAYMTAGWAGAKRPLAAFSMGAIWLVCTVAFELSFGRWVMDLSWQRLFADYNLLRGGLMPLGLLVLLFSPMIAIAMGKHTAPGFKQDE